MRLQRSGSPFDVAVAGAHFKRAVRLRQRPCARRAK
jgi:hypothetical protein